MIRLSIRLWAVVIFSVISLKTFSLEYQATHTHYSTAEGLPSNAISDIVQDSYGYIWIGTWSGLTRYDGFNFTNYTTGKNSCIPHLHNRILTLSPDLEGNIWMLMYDHRLFVLNRKTDCIQSAFLNKQDGANLKCTHELTIMGQDGSYYAFIRGKGIYRFSMLDGKLCNELYKIAHLDITNMVTDNNGKLWFSSDKGLFLLDLKTHILSRPNNIKDNNISTMLFHQGNMFIGTKKGQVLQFDIHKPQKLMKEYDMHTKLNITSLYVDKHGLLWFTTTDPGISNYNFQSGIIKNFNQDVPAPETDVKGAKIFEFGNTMWIKMNHGGFGYYDRNFDQINYFHNNPANSWDLSNTVSTYNVVPEGVLWISTIRRGLERLELIHRRIHRYYLFPGNNEYAINETRAILWDKVGKRLLVGNKKGNIYQVMADGTKKLIQSLGGRIYGMMQDRKGRIWISNKDKGLFILGNNKPILTDKTYTTVEDQDGVIWIASYGQGIKAYKNGKFLPITGLSNTYEKARTVCMAGNGDIWAGTSEGILVFHKAHGKYIAAPLPETPDINGQLFSDDIIEIARDKNNNMWIATNGGGLAKAKYVPDSAFYRFEVLSEKNGLPSNEIHSITFSHSGDVWFSSDQNICSYNPEKDFLTTYSILDGVGEVTCSEGGAITLPNGKMIFGTLNGYYLVDCNKLGTPSGSQLKLAITDFYINDKLQSPRLTNTYDYYIPDSGVVELPSRTSVFSFRFASLNYQLQHRVHYLYKLEGHDKEWHNAPEDRMVSFSDIPVGTYKFRVRAVLPFASKEQYDEKVITVIVPPYFLASSIAIWIYIILILSAIFVFFWWRKKMVKENLAKMHILKIGPDEIAFQHTEDYDFVKAQLDWLEQHYSESGLKIEDMVLQSHLSRTSYYNQVKSLTGLSPKEFISDFRLKKACMYLEGDNCTIAEVAYRCGFNDPVYFTRIFKNKIGITPSKYRDEKQEKKSSDQNETGKESN